MNPEEITGIVLAGGQSRRMGVDKASLAVGGRPMIAYAIDRVSEVLPRVAVVARDTRGLELPGIEVISDVLSEQTGALVGIYSALRAVNTKYVFVVACDMPHIQPDVVRWMVEAYDGSDAFVPRIGSQIEPLFAIYARSCLPLIEKRLDVGDLRVRGFFEDAKTVYVEESKLRDMDPNLLSFVNINTKEDLQNLRRLMSGGDSEALAKEAAAAEEGSYRSVRVTRIRDAGGESEARSESLDAVVSEADILLSVDGRIVAHIQCSPHNLEFLAVGRLLTEGAIRQGQLATVTVLPEGSGQGILLDVTVSGAQTIDGPVDSGEIAPRISFGDICDSVKELLSKSSLFDLTGAAHAAALFSPCGMVYWSEDISRHNAVDRVAGRCFLEGSSFRDKFLVTTGRINSEVVKKAAVCGIKLVASKAPPTDRGVELAERLGITVVGFVRDRRFNIYSHPEIWRREE